jgi:tetratricopeptide (TPR) repeat protein
MQDLNDLIWDSSAATNVLQPTKKEEEEDPYPSVKDARNFWKTKAHEKPVALDPFEHLLRQSSPAFAKTQNVASSPQPSLNHLSRHSTPQPTQTVSVQPVDDAVKWNFDFLESKQDDKVEVHDLFNSPRTSEPKPPVSAERRKPPPPPPSKSVQGDTDNIIAQMVDMGFDADASQVALTMAHGNMDDAIDLLVEQQQRQKNTRVRKRPPPPPPASTLKQSSDAILSQASVFGQSVFSRASTLFHKGKEVVGQKLNEYQQQPKDPSVWKQDKWYNEAIDKIQKKDAFSGVDQDAHPLDSTWELYKDDDLPPVKPRVQRPLYDNDDSSDEEEGPIDLDHPPTFSSHDREVTAEKELGNSQFKQGNFAGAEEHYTRAIQQLPSGHSMLVVLHNNRAATRIKLGRHRDALEDCVTVEKLIGTKTGMHDQLRKAVLRKANALEILEQLPDAIREYERASALGAGPTAGEGVRRCTKTLQEQKEVPKANAWMNDFLSDPLVPPPLKDSTQLVENSKRVAELRQQEQEQMRQAMERERIKDVVELRVQVWRKGKEDNIRALLSSLQEILWADFGWTPVGIQDVIRPNQVKVKYMKAIARLHPDKVSKNVSAEQQLLANEVFCTLNKAWDAFREQNTI